MIQGGIKAVVWTDFIQGIILITGIIIVLIVVGTYLIITISNDTLTIGIYPTAFRPLQW